MQHLPPPPFRYDAAPSERSDWPAVPEPRRRRAGFRPAAGQRGAALGLLGRADQQHGRRAQDDRHLRRRLRQHRRGFRPQGRLVPLPHHGRVLLLLHGGEVSAQGPVGDADEEPERGAGHRVRGERWRGEEGRFGLAVLTKSLLSCGSSPGVSQCIMALITDMRLCFGGD